MNPEDYTQDQLRAALGVALKKHSGVDITQSTLPYTWWEYQAEFLRAVLNALAEQDQA